MIRMKQKSKVSLRMNLKSFSTNACVLNDPSGLDELNARIAPFAIYHHECLKHILSPRIHTITQLNKEIHLSKVNNRQKRHFKPARP